MLPDSATDAMDTASESVAESVYTRDMYRQYTQDTQTSGRATTPNDSATDAEIARWSKGQPASATSMEVDITSSSAAPLALSLDINSEETDEGSAGKPTAHMQRMLERARAMFEELDSDGTELLEGDELLGLADWLWAFFQPGGNPLSEERKQEEAAKLLQNLDANGDGAMSFEEFAGWFEMRCAKLEQHRQHHIQKLDTDGWEAQFQTNLNDRLTMARACVKNRRREGDAVSKQKLQSAAAVLASTETEAEVSDLAAACWFRGKPPSTASDSEIAGWLRHQPANMAINISDPATAGWFRGKPPSTASAADIAGWFRRQPVSPATVAAAEARIQVEMDEASRLQACAAQLEAQQAQLTAQLRVAEDAVVSRSVSSSGSRAVSRAPPAQPPAAKSLLTALLSGYDEAEEVESTVSDEVRERFNSKHSGRALGALHNQMRNPPSGSAEEEKVAQMKAAEVPVEVDESLPRASPAETAHGDLSEDSSVSTSSLRLPRRAMGALHAITRNAISNLAGASEDITAGAASDPSALRPRGQPPSTASNEEIARRRELARGPSPEVEDEVPSALATALALGIAWTDLGELKSLVQLSYDQSSWTRAIGGETEQAETAKKAAIEAAKKTATITVGFNYI